MPGPITRWLLNTKGRSAVLVLPLLTFVLITPMTVSCQLSAANPDNGIEELRGLVRAASGRPAVSELASIEARYPRTRAAGLARFLRGYLYYGSQDYRAAVEALNGQTIGATTSLGDYAFYYRAESEAASEGKSAARRDFDTVNTRYTESLKVREARLRAAEMAVALGDPTTAIRDLAPLVEANDSDASYITAQAYEAMGNRDRAVEWYRRIYYELPATSASAQAEARLVALNASPADNPGSLREERSRAEGLFQSRQYAEAAGAYDQLIARVPEADQSDEIYLRRGISLLNSRQPAQAIASFASVGDRSPEVRAEAMVHQADALRRANRSAESSSVVDRLLAQYPRSRWGSEALYALAAFLNKQGREREASTRYRQLLASFPKSQYAPEASYILGWLAYKSKNYTEAARILEQHLASYRHPDTRFIGEACLWAGKSEERLGRKSRALALYDLVIERYRYGYHGYVSGLRSGALRKSDPSLKPEDARPGSELEKIRENVLHVETIRETADGSETVRIAKANDLEVIGLGEFAVRELNKALEGAPTSPKLNLRLAQLYSRRGENFQATLILRKGYPDLYSYRESEVPREAWEIFFPLVAWNAIKEEAKRYGIDPYVAAGLIRQESVFNPNATSRVGARGLMQVMPATGQLVSKRQGGGAISAADLYNPSLNIKLGMNYLAQVLGQFGRIEYAAAAYNAGPSRAQRWIAERGSMDIEDWIESIPFSETRGYVQGVLRYAANYRRLYKE